MDAVIKLEKVSKTFNPGLPDEMRALRDISLEVGRGDITVLKGPSGSGKTTLLGLIGCMARPTAGAVLVKGRNVAKLPERFLTEIRRNTFGFIFQQFNLIRSISVQENIMLPLCATDVKSAEIEARAQRLMARFNLDEKKRNKAHKLSGGEQQRVAIARALINEPEIILADEPTAHLDTKLSRELLERLELLNREGKTIIIATHDPLIFDQPFVSRTISMRDGSIREVRAH